MPLPPPRAGPFWTQGLLFEQTWYFKMFLALYLSSSFLGFFKIRFLSLYYMFKENQCHGNQSSA
jgi:hypothetical protein